MSSQAVLKVGEKVITYWPADLDPTLLFVFTSEDLTVIPVGHEDNQYDEPLHYLRARASDLIDRLELLGITEDDVDACINHLTGEALDETLSNLDHLRVGGDYAAVEKTNSEWLAAMTLDSWVEQTKAALASPDPPKEDWGNWPMTRLMTMWWGMDCRWLLRAVLMCCELDSVVELDLSALSLEGFIEDSDFDPQAAAAFMFSAAAANGTPAIIITEGTTDAEFIQSALALRKPHLTKFMRFFDPSARAQGGAGSAVATAKAFVAAGVNNRVVVLLDNDTAGHEAMRGIDVMDLPAHYATGFLPHLDSAVQYPTVGPTGSHPADINGIAGSIELYLGTDALTDPNTGDLTPVRWGSYNPTAGHHQAEWTNKSRVQKAFRTKVQAAEADPRVMEIQDWTGMDLVLDHLVLLVKQTTVPVPGIVGGGFR